MVAAAVSSLRQADFDPLFWHETQARLWNESLSGQVMISVVPAGRRSGKTELAKRRMYHAIMRPDQPREANYFIAAPTYDQARRLYQRWFDLHIPQWAVRHRYEMPPRWELHNGATLYLFGMDRPQRVEGPPWCGAILDEYADMDADAWEAHVQPALFTLGRPPAWVWMIGVPEGMNHFYDRYQEALENRTGEWGAYTWKSADLLPAEIIEARRATMDPRTFRQEWEASFEAQSGRVFYAYDRLKDMHAFERPPEWGSAQWPIEVGIDFNVHPMSAVVGWTEIWRDPDHPSAPDEPHAFVWRDYQEQTSNTEELALKIRAEVSRELGRDPATLYFVAYPDPAGKAEHSSSPAGRTDHTILRDLGWRIRARAAAPKIRDRVNATNSRFETSSGVRRTHLHPRCQALSRSLTGLVFDDHGKPEKSELEHLTAALGYWFEYQWPLGRGVARGVKF